jgi:transcriptional regulator with XRE-family HTH domain
MTSELQQNVGRNLRAYRDQHGLSHEGLADVLDLALSVLGAIERGERRLTLRDVERMAEQLDVDPIDLLRP